MANKNNKTGARVGGNRNNQFKNRNQRKGLNGVKKRTGIKNKVLDARQKITLKKRTNVQDARDVLTKLNKTQDARSKLQKIRDIRTNGSVRSIGSNILQKTDRNGKISLVTSKNKANKNDMNLAIQQQLGLVTQSRKKPTPKRSPIRLESRSRNIPPPLVRKTIVNDFDYPPIQPRYDYPAEYINVNNYHKLGGRIGPPHIVGAPLITRKHQELYLSGHNHNDLLNPYEDWHQPAPVPVIGRARGSTTIGYIDLDAPDDEEMPLEAPVSRPTIFIQGPSRSSNVHSRLDTLPVNNQSHGIFAAAATKTKVVVPAGHRIVVSNLQQTVTQDDIRELFEDIGQLLVARLVRPGTAEVIYKNLKDAQKAVDTYHNRQLDGQPMKCLLVNKRPINNPTGPALLSAKQDAAGYLLNLNKKPNVAKTQEKLVPDLQTIHKVLFQRN